MTFQQYIDQHPYKPSLTPQHWALVSYITSQDDASVKEHITRYLEGRTRSCNNCPAYLIKLLWNDYRLKASG